MHRLCLALLAPLVLVACGPKTVHVEARDVRSVVVRSQTGSPDFCPGQPFAVELVAEMVNGERCSTSTPGKCQGNDKAILDRRQVVIRTTGGAYDPGLLLVQPSPDALTTADGLMLEGWVVGAEGKRATATLRPIYACMAHNQFEGPPGGPGPTLEVAATMVRTPYYPRALLVRLSDGYGTRTIMAPAGQRVQIISRGGDGPPGAPGSRGQDGASGASGAQCGSGGAGGAGTNGGPGGPGGDGGPGGQIVVRIDQSAFDEIAAVLDVESVGGDAGSGGPGGAGGQGGAGGSAGSSDPKQCPSGGSAGPRGADGSSGANGPAGRPGPPGPPPQVSAGAREALFAAELARLGAIVR